MSVSTLGSRPHRQAVAWRLVYVSVIVIVALTATSRAQESALVFDGIDDLATIVSPIGWPSSTSALTVEFWVKPSDVSGTSIKGIVVNDGHLTMTQNLNDNSILSWSISVGHTDHVVTPTGSLVVGRWDHFAGTYDGTTMRIYQNGGLVAENVHPVGGPVGIGGDFLIGFWPGASGVAGVIDEVRIWDAVRTEAEIESWMSRPLTGSEPALLGYWRFDEGFGQVIADATSFGNGGVLGATTAVEPEDPQWTEPVPFLAFFFDGFESGDTFAWSSTVGLQMAYVNWYNGASCVSPGPSGGPFSPNDCIQMPGGSAYIKFDCTSGSTAWYWDATCTSLRAAGCEQDLCCGVPFSAALASLVWTCP